MPAKITAPAHVVNKVLLRRLMDDREYSIRELAAEVNAQALANHIDVTCSAALIGHLLTGYAANTDARRARIIDKVLKAPQGGVFDYKVPHRTRGTRRIQTSRRTT